MHIYIRKDGSKTIENVGCIDACSMFDPHGSTYVHIYPEYRERLSIPNEPHDWFFDTLAEAVDWTDKAIDEYIVGF